MKEPAIVQVDAEVLDQIIEDAKRSLSEEQGKILGQLVEGYIHLTKAIQNKTLTLRELRALFANHTSEKAKDILPSEDASGGDDSEDSDRNKGKGKGKNDKPKGHGRNGAKSYPGAETVAVPHESLQPGDPCLQCSKGTVYEKEPAVIIRVKGQAPLGATIYECQRLRCGLCNATFKAKLPEEAGKKKYDPSSAAMIGLLCYGTGVPFNRLQGLQGNLGVPLPASTQWDIVAKSADVIVPAFDHLVHLAANGNVVHSDDTSAHIVALMNKPPEDDEGIAKNRTGIFTSGIVAKNDDHEIALFYTGRKHAGENLQHVLALRVEEEPPILMSDALSRNVPKEFEVILANCVAHARRNFVKQIANFPHECRHVIEILAEVYHVDALARREGLSPEDRLALHKKKSAPRLEELKSWIDAQLQNPDIEPNSDFGKAIKYMQRHWEKLTLFLRKAGAPIDNNICERALKKAIRHRRNSFFFKTKNGARVGNIFQSLIHTAELANANALDYLTQLIAHADLVADDPAAWLPWNYHEQISD